MPLESPPMKSDIDHQLDEFLGFSYAASPDLCSSRFKAVELSPQNQFLGFSFVALNEHSLTARAQDELSDHTRHMSDGEVRSRIPSDGEVHLRFLSDGDLHGHLSSEDECVHPELDHLTRSYSKELKISDEAIQN